MDEICIWYLHTLALTESYLSTTGPYELIKTFYIVHNGKASRKSMGFPGCTNNKGFLCCLKHWAKPLSITTVSDQN